MAKKKNDDLVHTSNEPHVLACTLSEKDKAEAANQLATALQSLDSLELEKKSVMGEFKSRKDALQERIHNLTVQVKDGKVNRSVDCDLTLNFTKLTATLIRKDTKEIVEERPMTQEEKESQSLFEE